MADSFRKPILSVDRQRLYPAANQEKRGEQKRDQDQD